MSAVLRDRRFCGFKFRRQHPDQAVRRSISTAMRHELAVELDGGQHNTDDARRYR